MSDLLRKAAQAALEALEALYNGRADENRDRKCWLARVDLRAALAQPDQPTADGPTLPDTDYGLCFYDEGGMHEADGQGYTADQMLAFRAAGVAQERERCAKVCDDLAANDKLSNYYAVAARAIRKG